MSGPVEVIAASAGSGKTHRLCELLTEALRDERTARPEGVVAITYTRKAAAELESRLRRSLLRAGAPGPAARVRDGYIGTLHAVCHRLLREFALEGGLSPALEPMDAVAGERLFREALADVAGDDQTALDRVARRLSLPGWREVVAAIAGGARANGLDATALLDSAARSRDGLLALLPPSAGDAAARDAALRDALLAALPVLANDGGTKAGARRTELVERAVARLRAGPLPWAEPVRIAHRLEPKKLDAVAEPLRAWVAGHLSHPRLHDDLRRFVDGVFGCAARVLDVFQRRKQAAGVVDYDDMLAETARLLRDRPAVAAALGERLDLVLVDEFQDVSPLQLDIVMRLGALAGRAVWVGDAKQAIYGFQGSDPELMTAAMDHATRGRPPAVLGTSWRARPALVDLCSEVFAAGLAPHGFPAARVRLRAAPDAEPETLENTPFLEIWDRDCGANAHEAVAEGVARLLDERPPVRVRAPNGQWRIEPLRRGHVAVLARSNDHCAAIADALGRRGLPATVALGGLLATPEALLVRAGLALFADPEDGVAAAVIAWLTGAAADDPDAWLARRIAEIARWRDGADERGPPPAAFAGDPAVRALRAVSAEARARGPAEAVDLVVGALDLRALCRRWPSPDRRLANLEGLRGVAAGYETLCRVRRRACTVAGLLAHMASVRPGDPDDAQPRPADADAVHVLTWHAAKGLEWPVVVLTDLDTGPRDDPFGLHAEPAPAFDPARPLDGRWLRYWPWPYGGLRADIALSGLAATSAAGEAARRRERGEQARLLYVGFTRAGDRLVLFAKAGEARWLDALVDDAGQPALSLPWHEPAGPRHARAGGRAWPCVVRRLTGSQPVETNPQSTSRTQLAPTPGPARAPERIQPSALALPDDVRAAVRVGAAVDTGGRIPLRATAESMAQVGRAVHAFLAADPGPAAPAAARADLARACLAADGVEAAVAPARLLVIADGLAAHLLAAYGPGRRHGEWPVRWAVGDRLLVGEIDLVYATDTGLVVVDHKAFPGAAVERDERARDHAAQLAAYRAALEAAGFAVRATLIHFPLRGEVVEVGLPAGAFAATQAVVN